MPPLEYKALEYKVMEPPMALTSEELNFQHLQHMLTDIGLWQHTAGDDPNPRHGYSIDDEARGLIVALGYWQKGIQKELMERMGTVCFNFIRTAAIEEGTCKGHYHNFCDADGNWLDSIGSEDSFGRTLWGLGVACQVDAPFAPRAEAERLLRDSLPYLDKMEPLRAKAFTILGLAASRADDALLCRLAHELYTAYVKTASEDWRWYEEGMTYCNARLPQALLKAAMLFPQERQWALAAAESLDFYLHVTQTGKTGYAPIGNQHLTTRAWFQRGERRPPLFDQQPVDAGALVEACVDAFEITQEPRFRQAAKEAFGWYFGLNVHSLPVYNPSTGGVADAITRLGLNKNQGAESVLSLHLAYLALQRLDSAG